MKVMHNPPLDVRVKVEKHLEKDGKWLVNFAYGTSDNDERQLYTGIAYMPRNCNEGDGYPPNRYDVVAYDNETDSFIYWEKYLTYENALIEMGRRIREAIYKD